MVAYDFSGTRKVPSILVSVPFPVHLLTSFWSPLQFTLNSSHHVLLVAHTKHAHDVADK